jgi:hypothetical protein
LRPLTECQAAKDNLFINHNINRRFTFDPLDYFGTTKTFKHDLMHVGLEEVFNNGAA